MMIAKTRRPDAERAASLHFFVPGVPVPKGSMKAFMPRGGKFPVITHDNSDKVKAWASVVTLAAAKAVTENLWRVTGDAVRVCLAFHLPRPAGHYRTGKFAGCIRYCAPRHHTTKPDADKLARLACDAMTGVVWRDDSQIVGLHVSKEYGVESNGVSVTVETQQNGGEA